MDKKLTAEQNYKKELKEKIVEYILLHGKDDCSLRKITAHIANNKEIQEARRKRVKTSALDAYGDNPNVERYKDTVKSTLRKLVKEKFLVEDNTNKRNPEYTLKEPKSKVLSLRNAGIVFFQVKIGDEELVKKQIEANIIDKDILIIPLKGFLMCTMRNPAEYESNMPQLTYIREQVEYAIQMSGCELYQMEGTENSFKIVTRKKGSLQEILGDNYTFYWFDQMGTFQNNEKKKRRILILECDAKVTNEVYAIIVRNYSHLYTGIHLGHGSLIVIFNMETSDKNFGEFVRYIKKYPKR